MRGTGVSSSRRPLAIYVPKSLRDFQGRFILSNVADLAGQHYLSQGYDSHDPDQRILSLGRSNHGVFAVLFHSQGTCTEIYESIHSATPRISLPALSNTL